MISFEIIAKQAKLQILQISENDTVIAKGIQVPEALISFNDDGKSIISYPGYWCFCTIQRQPCIINRREIQIIHRSEQEKQLEKSFFKALMRQHNLFLGM